VNFLKFGGLCADDYMRPLKGENFMIREFLNYLKDEDGQTSTEYILLVAVVAAIIFKFKETLGTKLTGLVEKVFKGADSLTDGLQ